MARDDWDASDGIGLRWPKPKSWASTGAEHPAFRGESGLLDIRVDVGDLIDGRRLTELRTKYSSAKLLRIGTIPVIRLISTRSGAELLTYLHSAPSPLTTSGVELEEIRAVYVTAVPDFQHEICARVEDGSTALSEHWGAHATTPEGHLAFGPALVPRGWNFVDADGVPHALPTTDEPFHEIMLGGGSVRFVPTAPGAFAKECIFFRLVAVHQVFDERAIATYLQSAGAELGQVVAQEVSFPHAANSDLFVEYFQRLRFGATPLVRKGSLFLDMFGYCWELSYVMNATTWDDCPWLRP